MQLQVEQYTFKPSEAELRAINKRRERPLVGYLITVVAFVAVCILFRVIGLLPNGAFGILLGVLGLCLLIAVLRLRAFRKQVPKAVERGVQCEYTYSLFADRLRLEVCKNGEKITEEIRYYSDIELLEDYGEHLLLTLAGRIYILRKSDLVADSILYTALAMQLEAGKKMGKRGKTSRTVCFVLLACMLVLYLGGKANESYQNKNRLSEVSEMVGADGEVLACFGVYKKTAPFVTRLIDNLILVDADGELDVLRYRYSGGEFVTEAVLEGFMPESLFALCELDDGTTAMLRICEDKKDVPEAASAVEEFRYGGKTMYFTLIYLN